MNLQRLLLAIAVCILATGAGQAEDIGDVRALAVQAGDLFVATGRLDETRGALVQVHDRVARTVHRFGPSEFVVGLTSTRAGLVGVMGYPEDRGSGFAFAHGRFRTTFALPAGVYGNGVHLPAVPFMNGLLVAGDGGTGPACRGIKGHSPCGALYLFDVSGARRLFAFNKPAYPQIDGSDGTHAWGSIANGRFVVDRNGVHVLAVDARLPSAARVRPPNVKRELLAAGVNDSLLASIDAPDGSRWIVAGRPTPREAVHLIPNAPAVVVPFPNSR